MDGDARLGFDAGGYSLGKFHSIHGEGVSGGHSGGVGFGEQEAAGATHLLLQQPGSGVFRLGLERVGADQLGEVRGLVGLGGARGAHLVERDFAAEGRGLESSFRAGESAADNLYSLRFCHGVPASFGDPPPPHQNSMIQKIQHLLLKIMILKGYVANHDAPTS